MAFDIWKAFDKVWHIRWLNNLKAYGVVGPILRILESFLLERSLKVVLDGQTSPHYITNAGVPQGSVLGPTFFLVFINNLANKVLSRIGIYADDTLYSTLGKSVLLRRWNPQVNLSYTCIVLWNGVTDGLWHSMPLKWNCFLSITMENLFWCLWRWMALSFQKRQVFVCLAWPLLNLWTGSHIYSPFGTPSLMNAFHQITISQH